jgi:glucosyl-3-phosphoglycerate synthase
VFAAGQIRPDLGAFPGKGEAMWKSLFVTTGDVVAFIDADLIAWGPHFVSGLLGPLLAEPSLHLVKGFYDRLLDPGDLSHDQGSTYEGGRVTELVARPLLSLRWPELSGVVQPLAGEWAARRDLLASLHIPTGYGVELAVLVDTYRRRGLDAIAQVDLGRRAHTHQPLRDLGAMAVELMAVADSRAEGGPALTRDVLLRQFGVEDERGHVVRRELVLAERPPAASVALPSLDPRDSWQAANGAAHAQRPAPQPCAGR